MHTLKKSILFTALIFIVSFAIFSGRLQNVQAATKSIKHGETVTINLGDTVNVDGSEVKDKDTDSFGSTYLKFKSSKTGWLRITSPLFYGSVKLLDASKKALSDDNTLDWTDESTAPTDVGHWYASVNYGIKGGKTYYLKITNCVAIYDRGERYGLAYKKYTLRTSFKAATDIGGKTKSKAKLLKKGKQVMGIIPVGKKGSRWFKIKLKKKQKLKIYMSFYGVGKGYFLIKPKKGKSLTRVIEDNNYTLSSDPFTGDLNNRIKIVKTTKKMKKGTVVYVKIYNTMKIHGGVFTLKWK